MKLRAFVATVVLGTVASVTSVHAQAPDPCTLYNCMAGMPGVVGMSGGAACEPAFTYWHAIAPAGLAIYDPYDGFDSPGSAALRQTFLSGCPGSNDATNAAILQTIISEYGYIP
jgi:hypothetical protein